MSGKTPLDVIELKIPAKPHYVGVVRLMVSGLANRMGFSYDAIEDIKVAVAEACTNVVTHAYQGKAGNVQVICQMYDDRLDVIVIDEGTGFDIDGIESTVGPIDTNNPITSLKEGGLGIYLMKTLMDEVNIIGDDGVVVRLSRFLHGDGVESDARATTETPRSQ